jgi:hypothetical protein
MEVVMTADVQPVTPKVALSFIILPILTNLSILLFEICSLDIWIGSSNLTNVFGIIGLFLYYFGCLLLFIAYGQSTGGWSEVLGTQAPWLVAAVVICYPSFYLFWLPFIIYQLLLTIGTPISVWERMFAESAMSTELLHPDFNFSCPQRFARFLYIGIPFVLFAIVFIGFLVILTPLWYFILSPMGFGTLGICLHFSLHFPHSREVDVLERITRTYTWGVFVHVWALALPFAVLAIAYLVMVGTTWFAVTLAVTSLLQFVVDAIPSIVGVVTRDREVWAE